MDPRLVQLAEAGDVNGLHVLIQDDPRILEGIGEIPFIDTPLHIAAKEGQTRFCIEIMNMKPSFARKLNPEVLTPLHLALEYGRVEIVYWFIDEDPGLVRIKGKNGVTPLHYLVDKMENMDIDLLEEFIGACPESIIDRTGFQETVLHLAVKRHNLEAVKVILRLIRELGEERILDWKDEHCNTVLHLAAEAHQIQVLRVLLGWGHTYLTKDHMNAYGHTALDILESHQTPENNELRNMLCPNRTSKLWCTTYSKLLSFIGGESSSDVRKVVLVVATLIATVTHQTGLTPPRGIWQDSYHPSKNTRTTTSTNTKIQSNNNNNNFIIGSQHPHDARHAIMGTQTFLWLMLFNSIAFLSSILIIAINIPFRISSQVYVPLSFLCVTYMYSIIVISPGQDDIIVLGCLCLIFIAFLAFIIVFQSRGKPIKPTVRMQIDRLES